MNHHQLYQPPRQTGPFGLDPDVIAEIEKGWVRVDQMPQVDVPRVDISLLYEPIKIIPTRDGVQYPQDKFERLISRSNYMQDHTTPPPPSGASTASNLIQQQQFNTTFYTHSSVTSNSNSSNLADVLPKHDPYLIKLIKAISSTDTLKARSAINKLNKIMDSPEKQAVLRDYEEIFMKNVLGQLKNLSQVPIAESLIVYQPLFSILYSFFHSKALDKTLNVACLKNLMAALLNLMADKKLSDGDDGQYSKVINGICLKVLDKADFTNLNCALIRLLRETCPVAELPKFTDLLMKCIWRNVKILPGRSNELNYNAVINELHEFMLALPSTWWQTRPSDTPFRTVKTIIHNMAKIKGNAILQHLNQIPTHSELHAYLIKILNNPQRKGSLPSTASSQRSVSSKYFQAKRISNHAHEAMSQIFKLISDKDTKKQGLQKLYEFKVQNPDIDVASFLKGASPSIQKYIEDGLDEIERNYSENAENASTNGAPGQWRGDNRFDSNLQNTSSASGAGGLFGDTTDPEFWMDRLNYLREKANLAPHRSLGGHMLDNKVAEENLSFNSMNSQKNSFICKRKPEMSPNRLKHIQAKLAQIKQQNHS